jgi:RNA polymerase sigma-70 factor (ECF subfamily)
VPNPLEQAYELTLVVRSQIGDEDAFEELLGNYSPRLRLYVARMLGHRQIQTDDLLQEIWVSVFRALPKLNDASSFRAWLFSIARARICREFRRRTLDFQPLAEAQLEAAAPDAGEVVDVEALHQHLGELSEEHREALALRFIEEMSYEEIAQVTGHSLGTVRSRIHYAKRALRRAWEQNHHHELQRSKPTLDVQ